MYYRLTGCVKFHSKICTRCWNINKSFFDSPCTRVTNY